MSWSALRSYTVAGLFIAAGAVAASLAVAGGRIIYRKVKA